MIPPYSGVTSLRKVLVIGSGPIVIGQAAEFDYAGTQACMSLREEGIKTVLVNSNPATIMTDKEIADSVYIEPLTLDVLERVIITERPDGILPTLGGQTGLNLAVELADKGILEKHGVRLLGTPLETIKKAEDRNLFRDLLESINEPAPESRIIESLDAVSEAVQAMGLPLIIRPAYTLGGTGGGLATNLLELNQIVASGLSASPIHQVLLEKSLLGWKELEYEVMRDSGDTCITICNMENLDPMGVHTGDSIVIAPSQTLSDKEYQMLRSSSLKIIRALGIEGGCNVQFALAPHPSISEGLPGPNPDPRQYYVIEVNPRVSRSSALASKATGYPIARVAAKIAAGKQLHEIPNAVTQRTMAAFEPSLDYCVIKIPRWPFDKFATGDRQINTQMKSTGEVMAIGRSFQSALQKAVRSLELGGHSWLWEDPTWGSGTSGEEAILPLHATDLRLWALLAALRRGDDTETLVKTTMIDPWFISGIRQIVNLEKQLLNDELEPDLLRRAKRLGFSDSVIGILTGKLGAQVRELRMQWSITPVYKMVDTCAAEFEAATPYFYSSYDEENEAAPLPGPKALVIGSGPIRIGQGIEFDYCSVHAARALRKSGIKAVMVNSNPETVSTDFDTSDRLYFEPLDEEAVLDILENECFVGTNGGNDEYPPSFVQFGGQTAINLSQVLHSAGMPILGSSAETIDIASDRERFNHLIERLGIPQPPGTAVSSLEEGLNAAGVLGFPLLVRPSYVLGGRAMEIVDNTPQLIRYLNQAVEIGQGKPILIDKYLEGREVELDAVCDGEDVLIPGIMEHVEKAGVHSGDSMAIYPALSLSSDEVDLLVDYSTRIGIALGVKGLMNIQFVIIRSGPNRDLSEIDSEAATDSKIFVIEVNPRSSRTIPFISKVTDIPMVEIASNVMTGTSINDQGYTPGLQPKRKLVGVKAPVFSMSKLIGVDTYLGPEMKSTGEVMGVDNDLRPAMAKALIAANLMLPESGGILVSIADRDKMDAIPWLRLLNSLDYHLWATAGTAALIKGLGIPVTEVNKADGPTPNAITVIEDGTVHSVVNTVEETAIAMRDGFDIRRTATQRRIPCYTSIDTARVAVEALAFGGTNYQVKTYSQYLLDKND